jgi:hypothetical protein
MLVMVALLAPQVALAVVQLALRLAEREQQVKEIMEIVLRTIRRVPVEVVALVQ